MAVTLADIARELGLSAAAVSFALNGKQGVSEATKARVQEAAQRLGYRPNPAGRALRQSRAGAVGLYLPSSAVNFAYYGEATNGVAETLHRSGVPVLLLPNAQHGVDPDTLPPVDGYILIEPHADDPGLRTILEQPLPVVSGDRVPADLGTPWGVVESPNALSTTAVFDRFRAHGAKRPGLIVMERVSSWSLELEAAYDHWVRKQGLESRVAVVDVAHSNEELLATLTPFFAEADGCDAVYVAGDGIAARIAGILRILGREVGTDVRLISAVDSPLMEFHVPAITAVDLQPRLFGGVCAELMLSLLGGPRPALPDTRVVGAPLIERASG